MLLNGMNYEICNRSDNLFHPSLLWLIGGHEFSGVRAVCCALFPQEPPQSAVGPSHGTPRNSLIAADLGFCFHKVSLWCFSLINVNQDMSCEHS